MVGNENRKLEVPIFAYPFGTPRKGGQLTTLDGPTITSDCKAISIEPISIKFSTLWGQNSEQFQEINSLLLTVDVDLWSLIHRPDLMGNTLSDFIISMNLCSNSNVVFSPDATFSSPQPITSVNPDFEFISQMYSEFEKPEEIKIGPDLVEVFKGIVGAREIFNYAFIHKRRRVVDALVAQKLYRDAVNPQVGLFTTMANFWFIVENIAYTDGTYGKKLSERLPEDYPISHEASVDWYNIVRRIKHPDTDENRDNYIWDDIKNLFDISFDEEFSIGDTSDFELANIHGLIQEMIKEEITRYSKHPDLKPREKAMLGLEENDKIDLSNFEAG